jgi:site-specific DNA-methyltransferase (adenine-specific)
LRVHRIILGDNLDVLPRLPDRFARLAYIDPPFNTGRRQRRDRVRVKVGERGTRGGFGGRRYEVERVASGSFEDAFDDYVAFLMPRIEASLHCLTPDGSLFVHLDAREVHHVKVALDRLLGRARFMNEIVWAYDYGARSKTRWPAKHDTILWYALDPERCVFEYGAMDRLPYMAPGLVTAEKAARGKTPTDVWWHTIVPTNGKEKTGYPTQKPLGILERIVKVHSRAGDVVLDSFAGSGTTGEAAAKHGRGFVLIDDNAEAVRVMRERLARYEPEVVRSGGAGLSEFTELSESKGAAPIGASRRASARSSRPSSPDRTARSRGPRVGK